MAKLSASARASLPKKEFAGKDKSFPINDTKHARAAISGATRSERAGKISAAEADAIKAKARSKLGGKRPAKDAPPDHTKPMTKPGHITYG